MEKDFARLSEMVGRLLTVARLDAAGVSVEMKSLNLTALIAEVVSDAEFAARERQRSVRFSGDKEVYVHGNGALLRSAVENIVLNAVRYTAPETIVDVNLQRDTASAQLTVRDHGPGVPEKELKNIFRPFYRITNARDDQSGGAGLGLAITEKVIRLHRGSINAVNAADGGLEVRIKVPIA
jgi:two-component system sensor histidine kinase CpxA